MAGFNSRSRHREISAWPGWVDALSSLVMVVVFLLMVFVVGQMFTTITLNTKDAQLENLGDDMERLSQTLALERADNVSLRGQIAQISDELRASVADRETLRGTLNTSRDDLATAKGQISSLEGARAEDQTELAARARELVALSEDIKTLKAARDKLEGDLAALATANTALKAKIDAETAARSDFQRLSEAEKARLLAELGAIRDRAKSLEAELADQRDKTMLARRELDAREGTIRELNTALTASRAETAASREAVARGEAEAKASREDVAASRAETEASRAELAKATAAMARLNDQALALRDELAKLNLALDASEKTNEAQRVQIVDLGARLNKALASKVQELARYRSEFFGRVREALGDRPDVRIVGDRFVFQSELLFPTASANLEPGGRDQLAALAKTLIDIASTIPPDINWVLRVDGHTDARRIANRDFPSNWELSAARAISVVKFLIDQGIPPDRLAAAGFGEFQPLDPAKTEDAMARNRRIELKLDQR